jgi:hypothetical protein
VISAIAQSERHQHLAGAAHLSGADNTGFEDFYHYLVSSQTGARREWQACFLPINPLGYAIL